MTTITQRLKAHAKRAMLNVLALARCCSTVLASDGHEGALDEAALLREELDLVRGRLARMSPRKRPFYTPTERLRVLELRALRGWTRDETEEHLLVSSATLATWTTRCDQDELVQTRHPINRLPDFVRHAVHRLKVFCPRLGKVKIAQILCRAEFSSPFLQNVGANSTPPFVGGIS